MLHRLYPLLVYLLLPALLLRLWWRGRAEPGFRRCWRERLGHFDVAPHPERPLLWIHAVSLGETRAAQPLIAALLARYPDLEILLTHHTATGREAGQALGGERVRQAWLPWDSPAATRRFFEHFRPIAGILLETEVWPMLLTQARRQDIPVFLVNARLSARSARGYATLGKFARAAFARLAGVAAQSEVDAQRLRTLGAPAPLVTGNLKFDLPVPPGTAALAQQFRERWGQQRVIWVAGSTREGEEALLLQALVRKPLPPQILAVIVPRHPQRFSEVAQMIEARGLAWARRSMAQPVGPEVRVLLGDSMGELMAYYAAADFVFIGGSLLPYGCQNLIEACAVGRPVLLGPSVFNFALAAELALAQGAARQVANAEALIEAVREWAATPAIPVGLGAASLAFAQAHRGATARVLDWLAPVLDQRLSLPQDSG
jgi:3-deoxy-D-manno-octulosonic-acid transferase